MVDNTYLLIMLAVTNNVARMSWLGNIDEAATHERLLSAQDWRHTRTGLPKLRWLDFVTDELADVGVRDRKRRE